MIKEETKTELVWTLSDENKKEIIKAMPRILGYAIKEGYESISDLFDNSAEGDIIFILTNYIDFIGEEIEYIDVYKGNNYKDYVGDVIINYILKSEKNIHIKPDLTELAKDDYALQNFFWNHNLDEIMVNFLKDKPELKKELIDFCLQ
jgi:hypothetical protein